MQRMHPRTWLTISISLSPSLACLHIPQASLYMPIQPQGLSHSVTLVESCPQLDCFPVLRPPQLACGHMSWLKSEWWKSLNIPRYRRASVDHSPTPPHCCWPSSSWTYRVWPSDSSCLVIQLLSPFSVVRTFICLRTLLRSSSPGSSFPEGGQGQAASEGEPSPRTLTPPFQGP